LPNAEGVGRRPTGETKGALCSLRGLLVVGITLAVAAAKGTLGEFYNHPPYVIALSVGAWLCFAPIRRWLWVLGPKEKSKDPRIRKL
jgi:hypothetical protein